MKYEPPLIWTREMTEAYSTVIKSTEAQKQDEELLKRLVGNIKVVGRDV